MPLPARSSGSATATADAGRSGSTRSAPTSTAARPHARVGAAIHSVRAVPPDQMPPVVAWSHAHGAPLHAHLSEQPAENEACLAAYGVTPAAAARPRRARWARARTVVHATHLTAGDIALLGGSRTVACFCPTTEADLADGIGPARALADAGCPLSLGSDSHAVIDLLAEARAGGDGGAAGRAAGAGRYRAQELAVAATVAGHACLGWPEAGEIAARRARRPGDRGAGHPAAGRRPGRHRAGVGDLRRRPPPTSATW